MNRRSFVAGAVSTSVLACVRGAVRTSRPSVTHGVQIGDVQSTSAVVWARCDEPARMVIDWDTGDVRERASRDGTDRHARDRAPWDGVQTFGTIDVSADALAVGLWGIDGVRRYDVEIPYVG